MFPKKYFKNLDATRAIAFFVVFAAHGFVFSDADGLNNNLFSSITSYGKLGFLGLEYFFVLSSFLITWIALEEYQFSNKFKLKAFLIRRALRVWPLYFLVVFLAFFGEFLLRLIFNYEIDELPNVLYFISFIVNFYTIENGTHYLFFLVFLWSISIEEQFYIFWAFILKFLIKYLNLISLIMVVISILFRSYYTILNPSNDMLYFHTCSAIGNFGIGSFLAVSCFRKTKLFNFLKTLNKTQKLTFYTLFIFSIFFYDFIFSKSAFIIFERIFFSIFFGLIIVDQGFNSKITIQLGKSIFLNYLGKISYGLYCYHGIVITILVFVVDSFSFPNSFFLSLFVYPILILTFTIFIANLSFKYFESKFLKIKKKYY